MEGERPPVDAGIELSAYRIVQEALTNALTHGGEGTAVKVTFTWTDEAFQLGLTQIAAMGAANVVITLKTGCYALLRSSRSRDRLYRAWIPQVESVATVGSSDSLLAGFLSGLEAERENEDILKLALGCAATHTKEVGAGVFDARDVARYAGGVQVQEIAPRRAKAS